MARFKSWLFQIATNLASNWRRDRRYDRLNESFDSQPEFTIPLRIPDARPTIEDRLVARNTRRSRCGSGARRRP